MEMKQKNQLIEQYIRNKALQINSQYKGLMDEDKIFKAIEMFKDSPDDLETTIIPKINELANKMIHDYLEFQKNIEEMLRRKQQEKPKQLATLDLNTNLNGIYLSQQQIDLLMITSIKSKEELKVYVENICGQFPSLDVEDIIENFDSITTAEQLEEAKKSLYQKYQEGIIDTFIYDRFSDSQKVIMKLERLGIEGEELDYCISEISQGKINETFIYLNQEYGEEFITKMNRLKNEDLENVKSVSYDEMKSLSNLIKRDSSMDTIIIATGKFTDSVYQTINGKEFDPYFTAKALEFCYSNGKHMRYHSLFDHSHVDALLKQGKGKQDHDQILAEMKEYVKMSMEFIEKNNRRLPDGTMLINEVEIFNELVEKNKSDKKSPYEMVWEKNFGITIEEIISCFDGIKKPDGVEFMYNETTLTESPQKRAEVEKVLYQIEQSSPGLIDRFGDQMHLSDEDIMTETGRQNLEETAQMIKRIQDGEIIVDGKHEKITPKKTECTEHDFHFTREFIDKFKKLQANEENVDIWEVKRRMQDVIGETYTKNGVHFERSTYWSLFGKNDHNLCRANIQIQKENEERRNKGLSEQPLIDTMSAGIIRDGKTFSDVKSFNSKTESKTTEKKSFDSRSEVEVQIANQIREKNKMIAQQKQAQNELQNQQDKPKTLVKTNQNGNQSNSGFVNTLVLTLITGFMAGVILTIIYMIIK